MSGMTITAVNKDGDDTADDTPRPNVASLVSRFSQRKPAADHSPPSANGRHPPIKSQPPKKPPPKTLRKPDKSKVNQQSGTSPQPPSLENRTSVSDMAQTLGNAISLAFQKQTEKVRPHVSVTQSYLPPKTTHTSGSHAEEPEKSVDRPRSANSDAEDTSRTAESDRNNCEPDVTDKVSRNSVSDVTGQSSDTSGNIPGRHWTREHPGSGGTGGNAAPQTDIFASEIFQRNLSQINASVKSSDEDSDAPNTASRDTRRVSLFSSAETSNSPTDDVGDQNTTVQSSRVSMQWAGVPSSPVLVPPPPDIGAPPPYTPRRQPEPAQPTLTYAFDDNFVSPPLPAVQEQQRPSTHSSPISFHATCGRNVAVSDDHLEAMRVQTELTNAYIFTATPLAPGQEMVLKILSVDSLCPMNGMAFGMTACDPVTIQPSSLPNDADMLLERSEYWVVIQDVCLNPEVDDEVRLSVTTDGQVLYSRNGGKATPLMHIDHTVPMWAFFDISGQALRVKSIPPSAWRRSLHRQTKVANSPPPNVNAVQGQGQHRQGHGDLTKDSDKECTVCMERRINCVLYMCGHMCMCFECSIAVVEAGHALCPICRKPVVDVIKVYQA